MKLLKDFLYLSGGEFASKVATFAAIAYLARIAGPVGYGYIEFAGSVMLCAGLIVDQGFDPYGAREIAKAPLTTSLLVSEVIFARILLAVIAYASVILFAFVLHRPAIVTQLLLIYGLTLLVSPFLLRWVFQGHSIMTTAATIQVVRQLLYASVIFIFIRSASQIWIAGFAELAGVIGAVVFGYWMYRRQLGEGIRLQFKLSRRLFFEGVPIGLSQLFWTVRMFGATVIMGIIATPQDVGFFSSAMRIFIALHAFIWLYFFNLLPPMSQSWHRNDGTFSPLIEKSFRVISWVNILIGFFWVLLAPSIMVTIYGPAFWPAGVTLQLLAGVFVIVGLSGHFRYGLIAAGFQNIEMVVSIIGTVVAVVLIPFGYSRAGLDGAAAGLLVAEAVVLLSAWLWSRRRLRLNGHLKLLLWPSLVGGLLYGVIWHLASPSLFLRLLLVTAIVVILAFSLDRQIRELFRQLITGVKLWMRKNIEKRATGTVH